MSLEANMQSGAYLKFRVGRSGPHMELGFSNDPKVLKQQSDTLLKWLELRKDESNQQCFDRLEKVLLESKSGAEVIQKISV